MANHTHTFVETYKGLVGFGFDRETNENTVMVYLQKFSDDTLMKHIIKKMSNNELEEIFTVISKVLKHRLTEAEYHDLFLKD